MNNGDGLRVVLWLSGCSHHCNNCQNPQTWEPDSGILFDHIAESKLLNTLSEDYISGITLSGGDPLYDGNLTEVLFLLKKIRFVMPEKTIWIYTGYQYEECFVKNIKRPEDIFVTLRYEILKLTDVLVDGKYYDSKRDTLMRWAGSTNQRVIDVKSSLQENKVILWD